MSDESTYGLQTTKGRNRIRQLARSTFVRSRTRTLGAVLIGAAALALGWVATVWLWQDPFTALYTSWEPHQLATQFDRELHAFAPRRTASSSPSREQALVAAEARAFGRGLRPGGAIGRIRIPRLGLDMVVVDGTDESS